MSSTHVFHTQVQNLSAICIDSERVRLRYVGLGAHSIVQCPEGVPSHANER
jgi:hypothetical protein